MHRLGNLQALGPSYLVIADVDLGGRTAADTDLSAVAWCHLLTCPTYTHASLDQFLAVLFCLSSSAYPVLAVLFLLFHFGCPFLAVLSLLSCPG
jgi:hypothetical protein